jgi:hypothetical protein
MRIPGWTRPVTRALLAEAEFKRLTRQLQRLGGGVEPVSHVDSPPPSLPVGLRAGRDLHDRRISGAVLYRPVSETRAVRRVHLNGDDPASSEGH